MRSNRSISVDPAKFTEVEIAPTQEELDNFAANLKAKYVSGTLSFAPQYNDGDSWYDKQTNETKQMIGGQIRTLFNSSGQPGTSSPTIYSTASDAGLANGDTWYRSDLKEIRTMIDDKVFILANDKGPAGGGAVFTVNYDPTETVYMSIQNPISFVP